MASEQKSNRREDDGRERDEERAARAAAAGGVGLTMARTTPTSVFTSQSQSVRDFLQEVVNGRSTLVWHHQAKAVLSIHKFLSDPTKPNIGLCEIATGGGKSLIAVLAAYACNTARVLVITPSEQVSQQLSADFVGSQGGSNAKDSFRVDCALVERGIVKLETPEQRINMLPPCGLLLDTRKIGACLPLPLMITNAHKIGGRRGRVAIADIPRSYDLVIVDEAHHYPAKTWKLLVDHFDQSKRLFLTATASYKGKDILENQAQHLIPDAQFSRALLQDQGIIRKTNFHATTFADEERRACEVAPDNDSKKELQYKFAVKVCRLCVTRVACHQHACACDLLIVRAACLWWLLDCLM